MLSGIVQSVMHGVIPFTPLPLLRYIVRHGSHFVAFCRPSGNRPIPPTYLSASKIRAFVKRKDLILDSLYEHIPSSNPATVYAATTLPIGDTYPSGKGFLFSGNCKNVNTVCHQAVSPNIKSPMLAISAQGL